MQRLMQYWQLEFDWRVQEDRLNRLLQYRAVVQNLSVHFVHQRGSGPNPLPLIMTHGWPASFVEMEKIIPLLTDPLSHGGDPNDAFHVIVPSLPGFGFSQAPDRQGFSSSDIAGLWFELMKGLGYRRFGAQGGDIGAGVSTWLAYRHPDAVIGYHLKYISGSYRPPLGEGLPPVTADEQKFLDDAAAWTAAEGAYAHLQGTKPQSLAYALNDSPVGLAAWIVEKFRAWSDSHGVRAPRRIWNSARWALRVDQWHATRRYRSRCCAVPLDAQPTKAWSASRWKSIPIPIGAFTHLPTYQDELRKSWLV